MDPSQHADSMRVATPDDYVGMSEVIVRCLREVNARDYPSDVIDDLAARHRPELLGDRFKGNYVIAVRRGDDVIATGVLAGTEIKTVFVSPSIHGSGVGRRVMAELEGEASRQGLASVELHASLSSVHFYEKLGYQHVERVNRQVGGESFHMRKVLSP